MSSSISIINYIINFTPKYQPNIIKISSISPKYHPKYHQNIINFTQISSKLMSSSISIIHYIINFIHIINQVWNVPNHASLYLLLVLVSRYLVHTCSCIMNCFIRASSVLGLSGTPEQGL